MTPPANYNDTRPASHKRIGIWILFFLVIYVILILKFVETKSAGTSLVFHVYSITVFIYIISRFALAYFYQAESHAVDSRIEPTVTFAVPTLNEEEAIKETIMRIAKSDYPKDKFDIVAVNDGSTDNTLAKLLEAKAEAAALGVKVEVVDCKKNRGKRDGMAECARRSDKDLVVYIDSDTYVEPQTIRELVKYFVDPKVAAVAAHGYVANANTNMLTKMQDVRYFVAFKAYKSAEAFFGTVMCCSGCGSAYRRSYIMEVLDAWQYQHFLGVRCTYGDDRSLTNFMLEKGYKTIFAPNARVYTFVPDTLKKFMKQQLRWKKSWLKESYKASKFIWRRHIFMSLSFYCSVVLTLISPIIVFRAFFWRPAIDGTSPIFYTLGLLLMAAVYGIYYFAYTEDKKWFYGVLFSVFYSTILIWQLPYAIVNLRDGKWGTRVGKQ